MKTPENNKAVIGPTFNVLDRMYSNFFHRTARLFIQYNYKYFSVYTILEVMMRATL